MYELILDGKEMPEKVFNEKFFNIVGCTFKEWAQKPTTLKDGGGEWYEYKDKNFILGGTAYAPPQLFKLKNR